MLEKIIKKNSRNISVKQSYNKNFKFCYDKDGVFEISELFKRYYWITILLVLNKRNKKLVGIIDRDKFFDSLKIKNNVLILSGLGQDCVSYRSFTKTNAEFSGKPLLESTLYALNLQGLLILIFQ